MRSRAEVEDDEDDEGDNLSRAFDEDIGEDNEEEYEVDDDDGDEYVKSNNISDLCRLIFNSQLKHVSCEGSPRHIRSHGK